MPRLDWLGNLRSRTPQYPAADTFVNRVMEMTLSTAHSGWFQPCRRSVANAAISSMPGSSAVTTWKRVPRHGCVRGTHCDEAGVRAPEMLLGPYQALIVALLLLDNRF
jgi:hypothetical protein